MRQAEVLVWAITAFCSTGDTSTCHGKYTWASMQLSVCCQHKGKTQQCTAPSQVLALGWAAWQGRAAAVMMQQHGVAALQLLGCTQPVGHVLDMPAINWCSRPFFTFVALLQMCFRAFMTFL